MLNIFVNVGISSCCQSEVILPSARLWIWSMSKSLVLCDGHHSCEEIWRWPLKSGAYQWQRPVYSFSTYPWFHMIHLLWVYSTNATIYWEERSSRLRWFEKIVNNHGAQGFLLQSTIDLCLASPIVSYSYGCVSSGYLKEGVDDWYDVLQRGLLKRSFKPILVYHEGSFPQEMISLLLNSISTWNPSHPQSQPTVW